ncbi:MAG: sodium-translocating pyrophosphatase [Candidatus Methanofastidiosa archaeon]|nr:sodium-translocating pyrophosphatase [Candidatus Methanofastidiosa archaeon]
MEWWMLGSIGGAIALLFAAFLTNRIIRMDSGSEKMTNISRLIQRGAAAYLRRQYTTLIIFVIAFFIIIVLALPEHAMESGMAFLLGAFCSGLAGYIGMTVATKANVRTTNAARKSLNDALRVAFSSGSVMGMSVAGLGLLGLSVLYFVFEDPHVLHGFGFGASSIALFARVGGGIFTKAADVGADLVGKVEAGIPEDDPRNPAVIADNVGDNVGDVAGMGADLFESYVGSIISGMTIGYLTLGENLLTAGLPLAIAGMGVIAAVIGSFFVRLPNENASPHSAFLKGIFVTSAIMIIGSFFIVNTVIGDYKVFLSMVTGLVAGTIIGEISEYYTGEKHAPVKWVASSAKTGSATNIISGLSVGLQSTALTVLVVATTIYLTYALSGLFGISMAAVGMLSIIGMTLAVDAYGPVADNAGGIAEMCALEPEVRKRTDALDSAGNTTAAMGKGFAICAASLAALMLTTSYVKVVGLSMINLTEPRVIIGLYIGGMLPYLFSSLSMKAVGEAAFDIVEEVRRQFKEIDGIMEGKAEPDYEKCVDISAKSALKKMVAPGVITICSPLVMGILLGAQALGGMLIGALISGFMLAIMMSNSGGAWDNAKKYIEAGAFGGKGTKVHANAVIGDTVGDPFKDTAGPSMNILINVMSLVALTFAPIFI